MQSKANHPTRKPEAKLRLRSILMGSLAANAGLACLIGWLLWHQSPAPSSQPAVANSLVQNAPAPKPPAPSTSSSTPSPFLWSQLQAPDFPGYIERLRSAKCPESTIRDIIKGELDEIYAKKQGELLRRRGELDPQRLTLASQKEVNALALEEDRLLKQLLGLSDSGEAAVAGADSPTAHQPASALEQVQLSQPLAFPLVFQELDTSAVSLTPVQQGLMEQLKANFMSQVGPNTQDEEYERRWKKAQYAADLQLRTTLGAALMAQLRAHVK
jgi:hypothetical protein